ncbi:hypothetical protein Drorol1_Dr00002547 [Drosera rotundifolia]
MFANSQVDKGVLVDGEIVAIKRAQTGSLQGTVEFKTEIELLSRVRHKNLVNLVALSGLHQKNLVNLVNLFFFLLFLDIFYIFAVSLIFCRKQLGVMHTTMVAASCFLLFCCSDAASCCFAAMWSWVLMLGCKQK